MSKLNNMISQLEQEVIDIKAFDEMSADTSIPTQLSDNEIMRYAWMQAIDWERTSPDSASNKLLKGYREILE